MNNVQEVHDFVNAINCGKPIFSISKEYSQMTLRLSPWIEKNNLQESKNILESFVGYFIDRHYDRDDRILKINTNELTSKLSEFLHNTMKDLASETNPSDQPKRTNAYKEIVDISYIHKREESFMNEVLPIINYYYKAKTDSKDDKDMVVHRNNVQALFNILRKKYASKKKV